MRCFVAGAYGFIGRHVVRELRAAGWDVTGGGRDLRIARSLVPGLDWMTVDFNRDVDAGVWRDRLAGFDAIINCVGVLQSGSGGESRRVHVTATTAMFRGAAEAGVRRGVQVSALGAAEDGRTDFARDKAAGDSAIARIAIDTVILRPSLVYGHDTYGGTRLMRALAGLPGIIPVFREEVAFEPIHAEDLARIVLRCLNSDVPVGVYEIGGPKTLTMQQIVGEMRDWLGFPKVRFIRLPSALMRPVLWIGDLFGWLGAPSPLRSTTLVQALAMPRARSEPLIRASGVRPRPMRDALAAHPATTQDRLAARLGFALPALRLVLGLFWLASGVIALLPQSFVAARVIAEAAGVSSWLSGPLVVVGAVVDIVLGALMLVGIRVRLVALLQALVATSYLFILGILVPSLWLDPLGSIVKTIPLVFAAIVVAAGEERR